MAAARPLLRRLGEIARQIEQRHARDAAAVDAHAPYPRYVSGGSASASAGSPHETEATEEQP